jgi:hypothetical protein
MSAAVGVGIVLGLIGPFGSYMNDVTSRISQWVSMMVVLTVLSGVLVPLHLKAGRRLGLPANFSLACSVLLTAIPGAAVLATLGYWLWPACMRSPRAGDWYAQTLILFATSTGLWMLLETARASRTSMAAARGEAAEAAVTRSFEDPILCLQMEDHYVRVHRAHGSKLEMMSLREAVTKYGGVDGLQVHRSWWVAQDAIESAHYDARRWCLRLINGLTVPIARSRVAFARSRGWVR